MDRDRRKNSTPGRRRPVAAGLALVCTIAVPFAAAAQEAAAPPMVTDRPDATESSTTVAPGTFQLENGYTYGKSAGVSVHTFGEILLRVGVADRLEVRLGVNSYQWVRSPFTRDEGIEDSSIGIKLGLVDNGGRTGLGKPQVALLASTSLPTGAARLSGDKAQPELRLAASWDLNDRVALGTNVLYVYANEAAIDERFHQAGATLSVGFGLTERLGTYVEYFGTYTAGDEVGDENFVNGGLTVLVDTNFQLDGRVGYGLNGLDDDYFVGFGSSVRW